ncbi:Structural maintenance of chromosomes protein 6 [Didymosphaeria variabile]|uniref:Structural maintenance of chromosomes protein 6 n=1 Tax=Didymosphaeria variabile TaxID=1932322 RepID=A0A9W8XE72_9PLEO|nr:Structural maintenance of chromosomes protein 6 [Didymosphaeria variabile]KAJ4348513.1 Structural maintenance of chromosomes protein 6 [Didymosphaeria variabile]
MAQVLPAKRPHGLSHRHQVPVDSVASRRKRTRLSHEPSVEPSEASYAQDVVSDAPADEPSSAESEAEEDDEARFFRATQIVEKTFRRATHVDNTPAENGIIEEIGCINFMCHEQLTVRLGPLINFIIGHNGSGKSAVLTALTLCLGGKATATNRGQSLKSFIKAGKDWSTLFVKIKNQGSGAYKPDQFGDSIIVERHFTQNSTSGFKLKDRNGRIVSTKKSELEDIIDHFGLQTDNPLNVLTQDMARQFLNDSNAKEKYKFFLKGTQLETLDRDYSQIQQELEEQMAKHQTLDKDVKELERIYSRLEKKAQAARGLEKLRADETKLERQAAWSFVANTEVELADCENKISELSSTLEQRQVDADTASEKFARHDKAVNDATMAVEECQAELQPARDEEKEANANFAEARKKLIEFKNNERSVVGAINKTKKSMQDTQSQIDEQKERRALADGGLHEQKARELEDAKAAYEQRKAAWENHDQALPALNRDSQDAKEHLKQTMTFLEDKKREETHILEKIRRLEQGQGNWFDSYRNGNNLEKLLRALQDDRRFRARPVGPIGRYVELKHPRWSSVLEQQLGGALNAFVVTNKADHAILSEMMRKFN